MFLIKRKSKTIKEDVAEVVVSNQDTIVLGAFRFTEIQKGDYFVKDKATVDITATVVGNITATDCIINGLVNGNVSCVNRLWLGNSAIVEGSIMAKRAILETGCRVNGAAVFTSEVEVPILAVKIIEAEKIIVREIASKVFIRETDFQQTDIPIPDTQTLAKEQKIINVQKPKSISEQSADNNQNWW